MNLWLVEQKEGAMKIIIADDHTLFRDGLRLILKALDQDITLLEADNYDRASALLTEHKDADLALIDLSMPAREPFVGLGELLAISPTTPIVVLSGNEDVRDIRRVLNAGAMGFIPKRENADVMLSALRLVLSGGIYVPPILMTAPTTSGSNPMLTPRQLDVLFCMNEGRSNKDIGRELGLSEATVKAHITAIFRCLDVGTRAQALKAAEHLGVLNRKR